MLPVDKPAPNASSVFYDGVIVAGGADPAKMAAKGMSLLRHLFNGIASAVS